MKNLVTSIFLSFAFLPVVAQKVDLDKFTFTANYRVLPREPLDSSYHTYQVSIKANPAMRPGIKEGELTQLVNIPGWKRLSERAHILVQARLEDVVIEKTELQQREEILKDKYGKETGRRTWFFQMITYTFAAQATVVDYKGVLISTIPLANREYKQTYKGAEFSTATEANIDYKYGQMVTLNLIMRQMVSNALNNLSSILSSNYGYLETTVNDYLWILNSRKHPENDRYHQAWLQFKQAMFTMSAEEPLDNVREMMQPVISYLNKIKKQYRSTSKTDRKMRYASFYNLAKIYYYLDDPDSALAEAAALQVNDFDDKDGRRLEAAATDLKYQLKQSQMHSRHFAIRVEDFMGPYDMVSSSMY